MNRRRCLTLVSVILAGVSAYAGRSPDSLYYKAYGSNNLWRSDKEGRNLVQETGVSFSWLDHNSGPAMDPTGTYLYEAIDTTVRRHNLSNGTNVNYALARRSYSKACGTDGIHLYYRGQNGWTLIKANLGGELVSVITTQTYHGVSHSLGVARDTFWITYDDYTPMSYYGYALSDLTGDSTLRDHGELNIPLPALGIPMPVTWDGVQFYSACGWAPTVPSPFLRWDSTHSFQDTVLLDIDVRSVMCVNPSSGAKEECGETVRPRPEPTIFAGMLRIDGPSTGRYVLRNAAGRRVMRLVVGDSDVRRFGAGVYFITADDSACEPRRVVLLR